MRTHYSALIVALGAHGLLLSPSGAYAQDAASAVPGAVLEEVTVTAQKRAQSAKDVGLSITTLGSDVLERRRVDDPYEVAKLVPALSVSRVGTSATTTYTLRGIGFNSASLGASPTVAVYVDEVPLAYPAMTQGAVLDLERLEVYKGPQGIFFGQNSTAGAINFIAAKPTDEFEAAFNASYGRFDSRTLSASVSGPLSESAKMRVAVSHERGGAWQRNYYSRINDTLGERDRSAGRLLLDLDPAASLRITLGLSAWRDESDAQALQLVAVVPKSPAFLLPALANYRLAPHDARAADWEAGKDFKFDTTFWQPSLRAEWDITDAVKLTSITAYSDYETDSLIDNDGTNLQINSHQYYGTIEAFSQELRLAGDIDRLAWTLGVNYADDRVTNGILQFTRDSSNTQNIAGFSIGVSPVLIHQDSKTKAVFASGEYAFTDALSIVGGVRYTDPEIKFRGCNLGQGYPAVPNTPAPGVTEDLEGLFNFLYQAFTGNTGVNPVQRGGCITLNALDGTFLPTDNPQVLAEDNISSSLTLNYKLNGATLLYGLVSQGYKSGSFPIFGASNNVQYLPARQEEIRAYETGAKLTLLDRSLQVDGALFYYDYTDKQLSGYILDPIFGPLEALVNIPKSAVKGAEIAANWVPIEGLSVAAAATYIKTKIKRFVGTDSTGATRDFSGQPFNLSPEWFANLDVAYRWSVNAGLEAMVGGGVTYRSKTSATIGGDNPAFDIRDYAIVDLQAGIERMGGGWSVRVWAKNITNQYYWNNVSYTADNITRVAAFPATYGVTLGYKF